MPSLSILLFIFSHCSWLVLQDKKTPIGQGTVKRDRFCAYFLHSSVDLSPFYFCKVEWTLSSTYNGRQVFGPRTIVILSLPNLAPCMHGRRFFLQNSSLNSQTSPVNHLRDYVQ